MFNIVVPDVFITNRCNFNCEYCFESQKEKRDLNIEKFKKYADQNCYLGFFTFGGEPLMRADILEEIILHTKEKRRGDLRKIITNGSLIKKHADFIKKYKIQCQISADGPQHVHDANRVYYDGSGTYNTIIENIQFCIENDIPWSVHGVANKQSLPHIAEMYEWFFDMTLKAQKGDKKKTIQRMTNNLFQIIFEENYDDHDVDIFLEQIDELCRVFLHKKGLTKEEGKQILHQIFTHHGGVCGAGNGLMAIDTELNVFPCHRLASVPNKERYCLGNLEHHEEFQNFEFFNSFGKMKRHQLLYSANFVNRGYKNEDGKALMNWCPATNYQTSKSVYYTNPKYIIMHKEVNRKIQEVKQKYGIHKSTGQSGNCQNRKGQSNC